MTDQLVTSMKILETHLNNLLHAVRKKKTSISSQLDIDLSDESLKNFENEISNNLILIRKLQREASLRITLNKNPITFVNLFNFYTDQYYQLVSEYKDCYEEYQRRLNLLKRKNLFETATKSTTTRYDSSQRSALDSVRKTNFELQQIQRDLYEQVCLSNDHIEALKSSSKDIDNLKREFIYIGALIGSGYDILKKMRMKQIFFQMLYYFCFILYFGVVSYILLQRK